jgi:hypothetical protein
MKKIFLPLVLLVLLAACGDATKITPTRYSALNGWGADSHAEAFKLFADSCAVNANRSNAYRAKEEGPVGERQNWNRVCAMAEQNPEPSGEAIPQWRQLANPCRVHRN